MSDLSTSPVANPVAVSERLLKPVNKRVVVGLIVFMALFMTLPGVAFLWMGITPGGTVVDRSLYGAIALVLLALPGRLVWVSVRRKIRTGSWAASDEECMEARVKWASRKGDSKLFKAIGWTHPANTALWAALGVNAVWELIHHHSYAWNEVLFAASCIFIVAFEAQSLLRWVKRKKA